MRPLSTPTHHFADRRALLLIRVAGPILLMGNRRRARNLPMASLRFRQDSNLLYFTGCALPNAALLLTASGATLFLNEPGPGDALWHGEEPTLSDWRAHFGVDHVAPIESLQEAVRALNPKVLAVADENVNRDLNRWLGLSLLFGKNNGNDDLVDGVIAARSPKDPFEINSLKEAALITEHAHRAVMSSTHVGGTEQALTALFEGTLALTGGVPGYGTILTQSGDVLHHFGHEETLADGKLLLIDGGGEVQSGYGCDVTRTYPVNGRFSPRQRAAYAAVLEAEDAGIALCTVGRPFREVHDAASLVIARFLKDEGLISLSPEDAIATGAHALFFPHGVGHHLGLDVHDMENYGDRPSYPPGVSRPELFGTRFLRLALPLQENWVVTVEPGFYIVPAILNDQELRAQFKSSVRFDRAEQWFGFGGIRIEDDIWVSADGPVNLTENIPKSIHELEAIVGSGPRVSERFSV